jgi:hypothetical protein
MVPAPFKVVPTVASISVKSCQQLMNASVGTDVSSIVAAALIALAFSCHRPFNASLVVGTEKKNRNGEVGGIHEMLKHSSVELLARAHRVTCQHKFKLEPPPDPE